MKTAATLLVLYGVLAQSTQTQAAWSASDTNVSSKGIKLQNGFERVFIQVSQIIHGEALHFSD